MSERRRPVRRWAVRAARFALNSLLVLVILVLGAYLSRRLWLEDVVRRELEAVLADVLDADVSIGPIGGTWLDTIVVDDVQVRSGELVEVENARIEIALSPRAALGGRWLDVLDGARVVADRVRVELPESEATASDDSAALELPEDLVELAARIAPSGIRVEVADCEIATPRGNVHDRLDMTLEPRRTLRRVRFAFGAVELDGEILARSHVKLTLAVADPGRLMRTFGLDNELRGGTLHVSADVLAPASFLAEVDLENARLADRGIATLHAELDLPAGGTWRADRLELDIPGARVAAHALEFADPRAGADLAASIRGEIDVAIEDCARFRDLLAPEIAPWLPSDGSFTGRIADAHVEIDEARFDWDQGVVASIDEGRLPLTAPAAATDAALDVTVLLEDPYTFELDGGRALTVAGAIDATISGALAHPEIDASLQLGEGSFDGTSWSACAGTLTLAPDLSATFDVTVDGVTRPLPDVALSPLRIVASGTATVEPLAVRATVEIDEDRPAGRAPLSIAGDVTVDNGAVSTPRLRIEGPVATVVEGSFDFEARTVDASCAELSIALHDLGVLLRNDLPAGAINGRIAARGDVLNPTLEARLSGVLPDSTDEVLARLWPKAFGPRPADPIELQLGLARRPGRLRLDTLLVRAGDTLLVESSGTPPVAWDGARVAVVDDVQGIAGSLALELPSPRPTPTKVRVAYSWDPRGFTVDSIELDGFDQRVRGRGTLLGVTEAAIGQRPLADVEIDARLDAEPFDLRLLPREWTGLAALGGTARLSARVSGTVGEPRPTGTLSVEGGQAKLPGLPTFEALSLDVAFATDDGGAAELDVRALSGTIGAGPFEFRGKVTATSIAPAALGDVEVDLTLEGQDLLLARQTGIKVRGDAKLSAKGTLADLLVAGSIDLTSSKVVRRISLVPDFRSKGGASAVQGIVLPTIPEPLGSGIEFDVQVRTVEPFEVALHILEAPFDVSARLRGTGEAPLIVGGISTLEGKVRLPAMSLDIQQAYLEFDPARPRYPRVLATATGRRLGVDVQARVEGAIDDVAVTLASTPALAQEDITILLTTGRLPDDLRERGLQSQAALVGGYLAQEIFDFYFGSDSTETSQSFVDRFSFESGRNVSSSGTESLTAEFEMFENWYMQAERDIYQDYNMGVLYRIRF